ncbi:MAG: hypothetical protein LWW87_07260 [Geobacteraceae bacterium]|nr:hypothetical protein [Geobacteraceae bacterium]
MTEHTPSPLSQSIATAAATVFEQQHSGISTSYARFEKAIQQTMLQRLCSQTGQHWVRELPLPSHAAASLWKSLRVDLARQTDPKASPTALLEVKVLEQYQRNRRHGHEFPYLFYGCPLADAGAPQEQQLLARLQELGRPDTPEHRQRIATNLQRMAPATADSTGLRFMHQDEGGLLYDLTKMLSFSKSDTMPLFQLLFLLTYTSGSHPAWEQVHTTSYLQERISGLYSAFHEQARYSNRFCLYAYPHDSTPSLQVPYRSFSTSVLQQHLGIQRWQHQGSLIERTITLLVLEHQPGQQFGISWHTTATAAAKTAQPGLRYGVFDLETKHAASEVGGWQNAHKMGVSIAVLYDSGTGQYHTYREHELSAMLQRMQALDLVVGFNNLRFDNKVLSAYTDLDLNSLPTLDLLRAAKGRSGLDNFACTTLGVGKSGDGMDALRWYKQGEFGKIAQYCRMDVELTKRLYEHARDSGFLLYRNNKGAVVRQELQV